MLTLVLAFVPEQPPFLHKLQIITEKSALFLTGAVARQGEIVSLWRFHSYLYVTASAAEGQMG